MEQITFTREIAEADNRCFEQKTHKFLRAWVQRHRDKTLLRFDQPLEDYLANDALRDFFLNSRHPVRKLLNNQFIASHLGRGAERVYFDPASGDPLLSETEQRIYNLARRMDSESMHVPFRSVHPNKQTEAGDIANINTYPIESEELRYNSGNHFASRPANVNVFDEHSKRCMAKTEQDLHVLFQRGYLEERLEDVKALMSVMPGSEVSQWQFFVICSRHSVKEGHFGVSLLIMDTMNPDFPMRVLVCDTLLKELPHHPRWWNHFIAEYSNVFGEGVAEIIEDLSHPLQKVNIKGDVPYHHDWDCPYYAAGMADALADLVRSDKPLLLNGSLLEIHEAMKVGMTDYYHQDNQIKDRASIRQANRLKRWESGRQMIDGLLIKPRKLSRKMGL